MARGAQMGALRAAELVAARSFHSSKPRKELNSSGVCWSLVCLLHFDGLGWPRLGIQLAQRGNSQSGEIVNNKRATGGVELRWEATRKTNEE